VCAAVTFRLFEIDALCVVRACREKKVIMFLYTVVAVFKLNEYLNAQISQLSTCFLLAHCRHASFHYVLMSFLCHRSTEMLKRRQKSVPIRPNAGTTLMLLYKLWNTSQKPEITNL
jgi:hypothetical protein